MTAPDVYADASLARNSAIAATSSAVPSRCSGMCAPSSLEERVGIVELGR